MEERRTERPPAGGPPGSGTRIGVLGAGIAGLSTAAALHSKGMWCTVYEQAPRLEHVGSGIQISPNGSRQLARFSAARQLDTVATRPRSMDFLRWDDGQLTSRIPLGEDCVDMFGAAYYTLHRADLHQTLLDTLPPEAVELGRECRSVNPHDDGVEVGFADGTTQRVDLLIGADGLHSVARRALVADHTREYDYVAYRGLVPVDNAPRFCADPRVRAWFGPEHHCVCYPVSAGTEISFSAIVATPEKESSTGSGGLAESYRGWDPQLVELLRSAKSVTRWPLRDRDPLPRWSTERVTLVGDAAHPMLPFRAQGANQAIEDAAVLADCLTAPDNDLPTALHRYEELRMPRAAQIQRASRRTAEEGRGAIDHGPSPAPPTSGRDALAEWGWLFSHGRS